MVYVIHSTNLDNLLNILKSSILYANKYVDKTKWRLSGNQDSKYIYTNIYIPKPKVPNFGPALIFNKDILQKESYIFNEAWVAGPYEDSVFVHSNDTKESVYTIDEYYDNHDHYEEIHNAYDE